jgi:hypothetical protein
MKKIKLLTLLILLAETIYSQQNLVPNPSFEAYTLCPTIDNASDISYCLNWTNPTIYSPDYFNGCDTTAESWYSVPENGFGFQSAHTGSAYSGIITMIEINGREYIQAELIDTLISNRKYCVSFYVSASDSAPYTSNDIGVYFSEDPVSSNNTFFLPLDPQVFNNSTVTKLDNRASWTEVSGEFIAQGREKYITIGNFKDDASTDTTYYVDGSNALSFSYHFIDDVSVIYCDTANAINDYDIRNRIKVFPNPSKGIFNINFESITVQKITVLNAVGQTIFAETNILNQPYTLNLSQFENGIYFLKIEDDNFCSVIQLFNH